MRNSKRSFLVWCVLNAVPTSLSCHKDSHRCSILNFSQDTNKNGRINYTEFLAATIEAYGNISEDRIAEAFDRMDADDTGYISKKDLKEVLGDSYSQADIDAIMATGDKNRDGKISYKEFLSVFRNTTCPHIAEIALPPSERGSPVKRSGVPQSPSSAPLESGAVILESGQLA